MTTIAKEIEHLSKNFDPNTHIAVAVWTENDILDKAKERRIKITREQSCEILDEIDRRQDASIGISWDTIDVYIDEYVREHATGKLRFIELLKQTFESSPSLTPQFQHFYTTFRNDMRKFLAERNATDIRFNRMHFEASGFFRMPSGQIWYLNTGDVRWGKGNMLLRTAKSFEDYTGGSNNEARMDSVEEFTGDFDRIVH